MTDDMLNRARLFHALIREALMEDWDPIGVRGIPEAQDEYDGCVPTIYKMLIRREPRHEISDYLWRVETEDMTLIGNGPAIAKCTDRIMRIPEKVNQAMQKRTSGPHATPRGDG